MCSDLDNWFIRNYIYYFIYIIVEKISIIYITYIVKVKSLFIKNNYNLDKIIIEKLIKMLLDIFCF